MGDIRWKQRHSNLKKAMLLYEEAVAINPKDRLSQEGLIQRFEYTFELAWKCLQDILTERGYAEVRGPRPVIEKAFEDGLVQDGTLWLKMLKSRNESSHLYDENFFIKMLSDVQSNYLVALQKLSNDLNKL